MKDYKMKKEVKELRDKLDLTRALDKIRCGERVNLIHYGDLREDEIVSLLKLARKHQGKRDGDWIVTEIFKTQPFQEEGFEGKIMKLVSKLFPDYSETPLNFRRVSTYKFTLQACLDYGLELDEEGNLIMYGCQSPDRVCIPDILTVTTEYGRLSDIRIREGSYFYSCYRIVLDPKQIRYIDLQNKLYQKGTGRVIFQSLSCPLDYKMQRLWRRHTCLD